MEWTRRELKEKAKFSVKHFFWNSVLVAFILGLLNGDFGGGSGRSSNDSDYTSSSYSGNEFLDSLGSQFVGPLLFLVGMGLVIVFVAVIAGLVLSVFVFNPVIIGCKKYFLDASEGTSDLARMGYAFKNNYTNIVFVTFMQHLVIFLWSLLLIVPGIIKSYQYRMIPYLMAEDANLSFSEAKRLSSEMMDGEKWDAFVLDLSFILWWLLAGITFNLVGIFWVNPYYEYTCVELYKTLRVKVPGPYYNQNGYNQMSGQV